MIRERVSMSTIKRKSVLWIVLVSMARISGFCAEATNSVPAAPAPPPPSTPREFFNTGSKLLREQKLREAETMLEAALSSQVEQVRSPALYNLGHARFERGLEDLKKGPGVKDTVSRNRIALSNTDDAIKQADEALAGNDVQQLVAAYMRGRGARKEMKSAMDAVRRALDACAATLHRWQRASGDFRGAAELDPKDSDAKFNAEVVDRHIAKLVDSIFQIQQSASMMGEKQKTLGEKIKQMRGKIPDPMMPPGAAGDDDEEEDNPKGMQPDQKEGPSKEGQEMSLSPEQAGWLLEGYALDKDRQLPMVQGQPAPPKDRSRPDW
jgi:hypothetical protein